MRACDVDALEALARGELDEKLRAEAETHVADCASCKAELDWLVRERALFAWRATASPRVPSAMWQAVAARLGEARPARGAIRRARLYRAVAICAAAAMALVVGRGVVVSVREHHFGFQVKIGEGGHRDPGRALLGAENEYSEAIAVLEDEYADAARHGGRAPATQTQALARMRQSLDEARREAGDDLDGRARVLDGYSDYVGALQTAVHDLEVK